MDSIQIGLYDIVCILFCVTEVKGKLVISKGKSVFPKMGVITVLHQLSKEFPEFFLGPKLGISPFFKRLNQILSRLETRRIIAIKGEPRNCIIKAGRKKEVKKNYSKETLIALLPLVKRFHELIEDYSLERAGKSKGGIR